MTTERQPDETIRVRVDGHEVVAYSFGKGPETLFCLSGGPGLPCDYVRDSHSCLADHGYRVVIHDQLGTGASDHPKDLSLWTLPRFVEEVETVRKALGLGRMHVLGQSWGGTLGFAYTLAHPQAVKTFISANGVVNNPLHLAHLERLRSALGAETVAMMARHEADGTTDHPEYQGAVAILNYRHLCRVQEWPMPLRRSFDGLNMDIYNTMWGPNEFTCVGTLTESNFVQELQRIAQPVLLLTALHDEVAPPVAAEMLRILPNAEIKIFANSSHTPFFEEPEEYVAVLTDFLARHSS